MLRKAAWPSAIIIALILVAAIGASLFEQDSGSDARRLAIDTCDRLRADLGNSVMILADVLDDASRLGLGNSAFGDLLWEECPIQMDFIASAIESADS